ncbi:MAG: DUF1565 domain-containing protein, partial [Bacteroidales bacterium]|nr:DUF1565 domain-containing protein [Bacteroidales bacterium]
MKTQFKCLFTAALTAVCTVTVQGQSLTEEKVEAIYAKRLQVQRRIDSIRTSFFSPEAIVQPQQQAVKSAGSLRTAAAAASYSWYVSPSGSDSNPGTSSQPFKTIQRAVNASANYQSIKLADGTYRERLSIEKIISMVGNRECPEAVVIDGGKSGTVITVGQLPNLSKGLVLSGVTVTGGYSSSGVAAIWVGKSCYLETHSVIIRDNHSPSAAGGTVIHTYGEATYAQLYNTLIYGNTAGYTLICIQSFGSNLIDLGNVTIADNTAPAIVTLSGPAELSGGDLHVWNSILFNKQSQKEIYVLSPNYNVDIVCSDVRNYYTLGRSGVDLSNGLIGLPPKFIAPLSGKYQLRDDSPCIDAGYPYSSYDDAYIPPAKGDSRCDMGAYGGNMMYLTEAQTGEGPDTSAEEPIVSIDDNNGCNYVRVTTVLDPLLTKLSVNTKYYDGFGRPVQEVDKGASPTGKDVVTPTGFDSFGREARKYLPYIAATNDGNCKPYSIAAQNNFYLGMEETMPYDEAPWSDIVYQESALDRPVYRYGPGREWRDGLKRQTIAYRSNAAGEVRLWKAESGRVYSNGYYAAGTLHATETTDEDDRKAIVYTDLQERTVREQQQANDGNTAVTDWAYDEFGRKAYVLPPAVDKTSDLSVSVSSDAFTQYVYACRYDTRGREVEKHIPGAGWTYIVYNKLDQPVLMQGADQRTRNEWSFTKYDAHGRITVTGLYTSTASRETLQGNVYAAAQWEDRGTAAHGYTNSAFPADASKCEVLTVNYYDD